MIIGSKFGQDRKATAPTLVDVRTPPPAAQTPWRTVSGYNGIAAALDSEGRTLFTASAGVVHRSVTAVNSYANLNGECLRLTEALLSVREQLYKLDRTPAVAALIEHVDAALTERTP